jgi:16S rRNA C1402 N4-methylase RsmH
MRCFQALRIASNNELYHIEQLFTILTPSSSSSPPETSHYGEEEEESRSQCCCCLAIGGHFVAIAFHPGEDEVIKLGMKRLVDTGQYKYLTPEEDGLRPTYDEIKSNSRSRTARLRAVERIR